jgi:hypothetical protein
MPIIATLSIRADRTLTKFLENKDIEREEHETKTSYSIPFDRIASFRKHEKRATELEVAFEHLPRALLVSIVSCFDAYLGDLLRAAFAAVPGSVEASQKTLTLAQLTEFNSIEDARRHIIEKEIESVIRESHSKQFDWMENRFAVKLRSGLNSWGDFIELTERRNLFVHCDGVVSQQYIDVCTKAKGLKADANVGDRLDVNAEYFRRAWECVYEIGIKLGQVLWRKLSGDLEESDENLTDTIYDLLVEGDYDLAARIGEFAVDTLPKHACSLNRRTLLVNYCIALKNSGRHEQCKDRISREDMSDADLKFRLAKAVLMDDADQAKNFMLKAGRPDGGIERHQFEDWPLFKQFRTTIHFKEAYQQLFGEEFKVSSSQHEKSIEKEGVAAQIDSPGRSAVESS